MQSIEQIELDGGLLGLIYIDENAENPREMWDNLGTMCCFHKRYDLGDKKEIVANSDNYDGWDSVERAIKRAAGDCIILPVYLLDHSGITISTRDFRDSWDSGQVGFIYVSKEKIRKEYGWKNITTKRKERIENYLRSEVETYDMYITGQVYGYVIEAGEECLDSCWGHYGLDYCIEQMKESAKHFIEEK